METTMIPTVTFFAVLSFHDGRPESLEGFKIVTATWADGYQTIIVFPACMKMSDFIDTAAWFRQRVGGNTKLVNLEFDR